MLDTHMHTGKGRVYLQFHFLNVFPGLSSCHTDYGARKIFCIRFRKATTEGMQNFQLTWSTLALKATSDLVSPIHFNCKHNTFLYSHHVSVPSAPWDTHTNEVWELKCYSKLCISWVQGDLNFFCHNKIKIQKSGSGVLAVSGFEGEVNQTQ